MVVVTEASQWAQDYPPPLRQPPQLLGILAVSPRQFESLPVTLGRPHLASLPSQCPAIPEFRAYQRHTLQIGLLRPFCEVAFLASRAREPRVAQTASSGWYYPSSVPARSRSWCLARRPQRAKKFSIGGHFNKICDRPFHLPVSATSALSKNPRSCATTRCSGHLERMDFASCPPRR